MAKRTNNTLRILVSCCMIFSFFLFHCSTEPQGASEEVGIEQVLLEQSQESPGEQSIELPAPEESTDASIEQVIESPGPEPQQNPDKIITEKAPDSGNANIHPLMKKIDKSKYVADLTQIAKPRSPGSAHWKTVQSLCASRLKSLGFDVEVHKYSQTGVNVIGTKKGTKAPQEHVLISAHYDSVTNCEGADDNATGVAAALEVARVLSSTPHERTLVVACWDEEEKGLVGSTAYAKRAKSQKMVIKANFVFEMIGYKGTQPGSQKLPFGFAQLFPEQTKQIAANQNRGDFIALIGDLASNAAMKWIVDYGRGVGLKAFAFPVPESLKNNPIARDLQRSDHAAFWRQSEPGIMITDTANFRNLAYHCSNNLKDEISRLDHNFSTKIMQATTGAAAEMLKSQ